MKILVIADEESKYYWDYFEKEKLQDIDLIISCGDLKPQYLSFLATFAHGPVLYVHGNHDAKYETTPPEGCICIEDQIYVHEGVRIMGLGGSMQYIPGRPHQYTEKDMHLRILKCWFSLCRNKGFDILVTHAPAFELGDQSDLPHRGFKAFRKLMNKFSPKYMFHGHVHMCYGHNLKRQYQYGDTTIINAYERYFIEIDTDHLAPRKTLRDVSFPFPFIRI